MTRDGSREARGRAYKMRSPDLATEQPIREETWPAAWSAAVEFLGAEVVSLRAQLEAAYEAIESALDDYRRGENHDLYERLSDALRARV